MLLFKDRWFVPCVIKLKMFIMDEFHKVPYFDNIGYLKMITIYNLYYWIGINKEIANFIIICLEFH